MPVPEQFKALLATKSDDGYDVAFTRISPADLPEGDVLVRVNYSTINYKDGLAITKRGKIIRKFPLVPGIDLSGTVVESSSPDYKPGDGVVVTGWGLGEDYWGGYSEYQRLKSEWLVPLPKGMTLAQSMAVGTAGFTAGLCVDAIQEQGLKPEDGDVLVTGAGGGVGSIAVALLAKRGYRVIAVTGRTDTHDMLRGLGAAEIMDRAELADGPARPLDRQAWAGVVDTVGGKPLAAAISKTAYNGVIAMCGMAAAMDFTSSVFPFILRAIKLVGVESVVQPKEKRIRVWNDIARDLDAAALASISAHIDFEQLPEYAEKINAGQVKGRTIVDIAPEG